MEPPPNHRASLDDLGAEQSIPAFFEQVAQRYPDRTAIGSGKWQPTYAELNATANSLARELLSRGVALGERVAILMRHDAPLIAGILAVAKARGVVVVLQPNDPVTRLEQICADAEPRLLLTDAACGELAKNTSQGRFGIVRFDEPRSGSLENLNLEIAPSSLAFLIYTSGTTGRPKGVMKSHCGALHNALRLSRGLGITAADKITFLASPAGGQGLSTLLCALLNGAALCPFAVNEEGSGNLKNWITEHKISIYISSVSLFRHFTKSLAESEIVPGVRAVRLGAEKATAADFAAYQKHFPKESVFVNSLSSSETGNVTQHLFHHDETVRGKLPVGRPATGMEILLLDENGKEVETDEVGEIIVQSRHLSPGYWRNESLTAERFSDVPGQPGLRRFRTGDFGRRDTNGALFFMDRKDNRVKVRGYRVEISEVEEALNGLAEVEQALVSAQATENGETKLVAYAVLRPGAARSASELRRKLFALLPNYMVPGAFVFLDKFPLTPQGKVDRQALPPPTASDREIWPPRDVTERNLVKIFESTLAVSPVSRTDDFFDLGGTSLQSVSAMAAIEEIFNVALPPSTLMGHGTVERLASLLSRHAVMNSPRPLVVLREEQSGRPLFFIHSGQGDVVTYGLLARRIAARPVYGLQAIGIQGESWPLTSIPKMAERYLQEILEKDPTGPYLLAGTCMGGMVAFELAQRLVRINRKVALLALMDSPTAPYSGRRSRSHEMILDPLRDALRMLRWGIFRACGFKISVQRLPAYRHFVAEMTGRATRRYRPEPYPGTVTVMMTKDTQFRLEDRRPLIGQYAREMRTVMLSGTRSRLFLTPQVDELAKHLQACLDAPDSESNRILPGD